LRIASQNHGGKREDVSALHTEAEVLQVLVFWCSNLYLY